MLLTDITGDIIDVLVERLPLSAAWGMRSTCRRFRTAPELHFLDEIRRSGDTMKERLVELSREGRVKLLAYLLIRTSVAPIAIIVSTAEASGRGQLEALRLLLDVSMDLSISAHRLFIKTRLDVSLGAACRRGQIDAVRLLIDAGANVNAKIGDRLTLRPTVHRITFPEDMTQDQRIEYYKNYNNMTPLMIASHYGHGVCVQELLAKGADVNKNFLDNGKTALMYASAGGHLSCVQALIDARADVNQEDHHGHTPALIAYKQGHQSCFDALIKAGAQGPRG